MGGTMLDELRRQVYRANKQLVEAGLVVQTFGNASGIDRESGCVVIKPSGVAYEDLSPECMVPVSLENGAVLDGRLKPSSDTATHLALYRAFPAIGGVVHTHSFQATAWAQAKREIPPLGTTHADYFHGPVPCTRLMTAQEIRSEYEANTGLVIVERFAKLDVLACPAVLVASHGPFAWGQSVSDAVHHAEIVEYLARMASETLRLAPRVRPMQRALLDKHFFRKHGKAAYYGQNKPV
jgi:L-ribulose-5-phosphate 4-epimerase